MYIESVPNRNSPPCILPRESYRQGGKVKKRTIANLSKWPSELVESFRVLLRGGTVVKHLEESFDVVRSRPYGHVAAVPGTLRKIGLDRVIFVGNRGAYHRGQDPGRDSSCQGSGMDNGSSCFPDL